MRLTHYVPATVWRRLKHKKSSLNWRKQAVGSFKSVMAMRLVIRGLLSGTLPIIAVCSEFARSGLTRLIDCASCIDATKGEKSSIKMFLGSSGEEGCAHLWVYIGVQSVLIILCIVDLALNTWFHYCLWDFGLVHAHTDNSYINFIYDESSIADVQEDMCWGRIISIEVICPNFCEYIGNFKEAGGAMILLGTFTLVAAIGTIGFHVFALRGKPLKSWLVWVWLPLPAAMWILGTLLYVSAVDFPSIDNVKEHSLIKNFANPRDAEPDVGLYFCGSLAVLHILLLVYALLTTRKNFQRD